MSSSTYKMQLFPHISSRMESSSNFSDASNDSCQNTEEDQAALMEINRQKAELLIPVILYIVILMVIGSVGNPIAIYIYGWKWQNTTTRVFLFWLAVIDLINCLITMPTEIYVMINFYYFPNASFCRLSRFITYVINNSTSAIFLAVAIDRYIRICHPHWTTISIVGAQLACVISLFIGVGVSWPALVLYGSKSVKLLNSRNENGFIWGIICDVKNEMDLTPYPLAFFIYLWCGFSACVLLLSIMYIMIGRIMLKRRKNRRKHEDTEPARLEHNGDGDNIHKEDTREISHCPEERNSGDTKCSALHAATSSWRQNKLRPPKSTLMLFAITAVFVLSFLPFLIVMTVRQHFGPFFYPSLTPAEQVAVNLFSRSYLVNNCANPIVYGMCNSQFRDQVKKLFGLPRKTRERSLSREESWLSRGLSCSL